MVRKPAQSPLSPKPPEPAAAAASLPSGRRKPMILKEPEKRGPRCAEMAGETAAECAAICCCCPCGLVNLLLVVAFKLPAGLVRRALRQKRNAPGKKVAILRPRVGTFGGDDDLSIHCGALLATTSSREVWPSKSPSEELSDLEKVMLANFYGAGFWRSPSQRECTGKLLFQSPW